MTELRVDDEIVLRTPTLADAPRMFEIIDANREHLGPWMPWAYSIRTVADEKAWMRGRLKPSGAPREHDFLIVYRGEAVGAIDLHGPDSPPGYKEIGFWIGASCVGRGIVTRACQAVTAYGFDTLGLDKLAILMLLRNRRSRAVAERCQFKLDDIVSIVNLATHRPRKFYRYALTRDEWSRLRES